MNPDGTLVFRPDLRKIRRICLVYVEVFVVSLCLGLWFFDTPFRFVSPSLLVLAPFFWWLFALAWQRDVSLTGSELTVRNYAADRTLDLTRVTSIDVCDLWVAGPHVRLLEGGKLLALLALSGDDGPSMLQHILERSPEALVADSVSEWIEGAAKPLGASRQEGA